MKVRIPKQIELAGNTIKIKVMNDIEMDGAVGLSKFNQNEILVRRKLDGELIPIDIRSQTYAHELVHFILHVMNEHEVNNNEKFVDTFGQLLYQAMKSAKY